MLEYISNASAASTAFSAAAAAAAEAAAAEVRADLVRGERAISQHLCSASAQMVLVAVVQAKQQSIYQSALPGGELAEQETSKRKRCCCYLVNIGIPDLDCAGCFAVLLFVADVVCIVACGCNDEH